jgi:hypothetical protein
VIQLARKAVLSTKSPPDSKDSFSSEVMEFALSFSDESGDAFIAKGISSGSPYLFVGNISGETKLNLQLVDEFGQLLAFT